MPAEISTAYSAREQALHENPDQLSLLRVAYGTLREIGRRTAYNRTLARQQADTATTPSAVEPPLQPVGATLGAAGCCWQRRAARTAPLIDAAARALLGKPPFPIALAPARYFPNY